MGTFVGPYAGILPWARSGDGSIVFLLGQERHEDGWDESSLWSDFGGGVERDQDANAIEAAARECYEETMGMLGSRADIADMLRRADDQGQLGRLYSPRGAVIFLLEVDHDPALPVYFERAVRYAYDAANAMGDGHVFPPKGYYEKSAMAWVPADRLASLVLRDALAPEEDPHVRRTLRRDFVRTTRPLFCPDIATRSQVQ